MKAEIVIIDPKEFGLEKKNVESIEQAFAPKIAERNELNKIYSKLIKKELTPDICNEFCILRRKLVKVRTGISEIHKTQKAFFLASGKFVDAWKNKETAPVVQMEETLLSGEKHFENIEKERIIKLTNDRLKVLQEYEPLTLNDDRLGLMDVDVWNNYINGVKLNFEQVKAEEAKAEKERIEAKKAEIKRIADIEKENEKLAKEKAEAEKERLKLAKIQEEKDKKTEIERQRIARLNEEKLAKEKAEKQKLADELEAKRVKEIKAKQAEKEEAYKLVQAELNKGDSDKVKDLISHLEEIKTEYTFKSKVNQKMYIDVCGFIDKVINHINKQ